MNVTAIHYFLVYYTTICEQPYITLSVFQISLTQATNSTGPNTLPCGTPQVTLNSSDNCPSTLTLCERPKRVSFTHTTTESPNTNSFTHTTTERPNANSFIHTTTLKSTQFAAISVSSLSFGTELKAFEKSIITLACPQSLVQSIRVILKKTNHLTFPSVPCSKTILTLI